MTRAAIAAAPGSVFKIFIAGFGTLFRSEENGNEEGEKGGGDTDDVKDRIECFLFGVSFQQGTKLVVMSRRWRPLDFQDFFFLFKISVFAGVDFQGVRTGAERLQLQGEVFVDFLQFPDIAFKAAFKNGQVPGIEQPAVAENQGQENKNKETDICARENMPEYHHID